MRKNMFLKRPFQKSHDINEKLFNVDTNDGLKNISISSATNDILIMLHIYKSTCYINTYLR